MSENAESDSRGNQELDELYRCTECGKVSVSIGWLHAHIDGKHHGFGPFNIIPNPLAIGNFDRCMEKTEVIGVTDYELRDEPQQVTS